MRINIINLDKERWILTKISKKLVFNLTKLGHTVFLSKKPRTDVDVNHFIIFLFQKEDKSYYPKNTINTTMLTHVNDDFRFKKLKKISQFIDAGIAFSNHHKKFIEKKSLGVKKIFHILPPTDDDVKLKKINFGIFTDLYSDGRKEEDFFFNSFINLDPHFFKLSIIGKGWKKYVKAFQEKNIEVDFQRFFFRKLYLNKMSNLDYLIYLGNDEGSMSFLDAIQLGIKTIMVPQGFQSDLQEFITYKVDKNLRNFPDIISKIIREKQKFMKIKKKLNWTNYAFQHCEIWKNLKIKIKN